MANKVLQLIKESGAKWVDFRFTDTKGKEQHVTYPADTIDEDTFEDGKMFDGSSIAGWKGIEASDMILRPDAETGFANVLEDLIQRNPRITSIDLIGHSMGGLVSRSALFYGKQNLHQWVHMVENLVCIGSPHHGAVLERFGFVLQDKLGAFPFISLIGQLVNVRSNGILDLRYGSVRDDDWEHNDARIGFADDNRKPAPLPSHINTFLIAGTLEFEKVKNKALKVIGDYLVSVKSALGEHPNPRFQLKLPDTHKAVFYGLNHFEIQYHSSVAEQITRWLYPEVGEVVEEGVQTHMINVPNNYTFDDLEGIVET